MSGPCLSSSVAGHPLRPATRHRLGGPLPRQLTNRTRAPPQAHCCFTLASLSGINPSFPGLSLSWGQVTHVLLTRAPLSARRHSVRLACLIHAASVRSEPESNSPNRKMLNNFRCYLSCSEKPDMLFYCCVFNEVFRFFALLRPFDRNSFINGLIALFKFSRNTQRRKILPDVLPCRELHRILIRQILYTFCFIYVIRSTDSI